ncbi:MAG: lysine--tRNA ligase [Thermoprotei archaeon]|nr:MAG: lysine--tRNA ligase [Thermoprotei archaeon]
MVHWAERKAEEVVKTFREIRDVLVCNGGLSVSGLQHVGRLRGEVTIVDTVRKILEKRGYEAKHTIVLYTMDAWKGKETQLKQFSDPEEAKAFTGRPLFLVPDPQECHKNWVEHYWENFGNYLQHFALDVEVVSTKELYEKNMRMKEFIVKTLTEKRSEAVRTINKYRGRNPHPEDWIPFNPICEKCLRIDSTVAVSFDEKTGIIEYICKACGNEGRQPLERGKLTWRLEWVGVWYSMGVSFEPYGKDHATPGGSRDSCNDLARNVYRFEPPVGLPYEWVGYSRKGVDVGDMGSSDFIGFTPKDWIEVAEGEVLRYIYLFTQPMKRIVLSLERVPLYVDEYDKAERIYYGLEALRDTEENERISKSYYLAQLREPPSEPPIQLPYLHAVALIQVLPKHDMVREALKRLEKTGLIKSKITDFELERIKRRLINAQNWIASYAPDRYKISLLPHLTAQVLRSIDRDVIPLLKELYDKLEELEEWTEDDIKQVMMSIKRTKHQEREFFKALYLMFFGREYGPRIAPYLSFIDKSWVLNRLREVLKYYAKQE